MNDHALTQGEAKGFEIDFFSTEVAMRRFERNCFLITNQYQRENVVLKNLRRLAPVINNYSMKPC